MFFLVHLSFFSLWGHLKSALAKKVFGHCLVVGLLYGGALGGVVWAQQPVQQQREMLGNVDGVQYLNSHNQLMVQGWAWDRVTASTATRLEVEVGNKTYAVTQLQRQVRSDVPSTIAPGNSEIGFLATLRLSQALPAGEHEVLVRAVFADGRSLEMLSGQGESLSVTASKPKDRHWILLALVLLSVGVAYLPIARKVSLQTEQWVQLNPGHISMMIAGVFALLVCFGVTGSSWQLLTRLPGNDLVQVQGGESRIFKLRGIRSDEWSVQTPNTLAQWSHEPRFPVVNTNLGLQGQNMGVVGMTGTPVAQLASIGRVATWGYFVLPLRQAMSWQWWLPFFGCLFFLWKALNLINQQRSGFHLLLAFAFCVAPYAAGWSLWPLYATGMPLALFVLAAAALRTRRTGVALVQGAALGVLLTGWFLILYPPWQVTVGTFVLVLGIAWVRENRHQLHWQKAQWCALGLALLVAALLLGSWWMDTADAVAKIRATVYPGGRTALQGADVVATPWWTFRGYVNPEALTFGLGAGEQQLPPHVIANQSELSSYLILPLPILLLGAWRCLRGAQQRSVLMACMAFVLFWLVFRFVGVPLWVAKLTQWSHVTGYRLDLVMGLVCTVLLAVLFPKVQSEKWRWPLPLLVAAVGGLGLVLWEFELLPPGLLKANSWPLQWAIALAVAWGTWWMLRARPVAAVGLMLMLSLVSTLGFNPVSLAPQGVQLSEHGAALVEEKGKPLRTLVISDGAATSMLLAAAGVPTVGGVLYYPQKELWQRMQLDDANWPVVNRYQHLSFNLAKTLDAPAYTVHNPQGDVVVVTVNPRSFDFMATGAERVLAAPEQAALLRTNPLLEQLPSVQPDGWVGFKSRK